MKIMHVRIAIAALALALWGCSPGPDFVRPDAPRVHRYTGRQLALEEAPRAADAGQHLLPGEPVPGAWWTLFESPALDTVVNRALANNRTLAAASSALAQAGELARAQAGTLYPQVGLSAGAGRQKYGAQFLGTSPKPPAFTYFSVGPSVSYALDYTGGAARSVEQKYALADYQRQQLDAARLAVTGNAVMLSFQIASLRAQSATVDEILQQDRENLKLVQEAFAAGSVARIDIVTAESQIATDSTALPPLRQQLRTTEHALAVVLGEAPANVVVPAFDFSDLTLPRNIPVGIPSELAHHRPDILAAEAQLHAATAEVGIANANLYPRIDLNASTGQQVTSLASLLDRASNVWSLITSLTVPLFDGGTLRAEQRAAVEAMHASAANYEQTVLVAFGQVADALEALESDAEQMDAQSRAQDAARANVDLTQRSYNEGNVGVLQVLDAERSYQQARLGFVRARAQRYTDTARLFLALGGSAPADDRSLPDAGGPRHSAQR